ncbi:MAG: hypothetical protein ABJC10_07800, partial [Acidobacteriota bacterium]
DELGNYAADVFLTVGSLAGVSSCVTKLLTSNRAACHQHHLIHRFCFFAFPASQVFETHPDKSGRPGSIWLKKSMRA